MKGNKYTVLYLLILSHIIWFLGSLVWQHYYNGDAYEYIYLAENMKKGWYYGGNPALPINEYLISARTPIYAIFIGLFYTLFGEHTIPILVAQNLLSIGACWLIYKAFSSDQIFVKYKWLYIVFIVFYPAQVFFADTLCPDILLQFFLILYILPFIKYFNSGKLPLLTMGIWLLLATLTKPIMYPFLLAHLVFVVIYAFKTKRWKTILLGALPLIGMTFYGVWNYQRTHLFHISSIQSHNLLHFNARFFLAHKYNFDYADSVIRAKDKVLETIPGINEKYNYASREATSILKEHMLDYAFFHTKESLRFFVDPGKSELDLHTGYLTYNFDPNGTSFYKELKNNGLNGVWHYLMGYPYFPLIVAIFGFNLLRVVGFALFLWKTGYDYRFKILITLYILYFAAITGPVANTRYFLSVLLVMSALSTIGWGFLFSKFNKKLIINT